MEEKSEQIVLSKPCAIPGFRIVEGHGNENTLNEKQAVFVREYILQDYNATKAYMIAYGSEESDMKILASNASRMLKNAKIQRAIDAEEGSYLVVARKNGITKDKIMKKIHDLIFNKVKIYNQVGKCIGERDPTINESSTAITLYSKFVGGFAPDRRLEVKLDGQDFYPQQDDRQERSKINMANLTTEERKNLKKIF